MIFATLILHAAVQKYEIHVFIVSYTCWYYVSLQLRCWSSLRLIELGKGNVFGDLEVRKNDGGGGVKIQFIDRVQEVIFGSNYWNVWETKDSINRLKSKIVGHCHYLFFFIVHKTHLHTISCYSSFPMHKKTLIKFVPPLPFQRCVYCFQTWAVTCSLKCKVV